MSSDKKSCLAVVVAIGVLSLSSFANAGQVLPNSNYIKKIPKKHILKTKERKKVYKVLEKTFLLDKPSKEGRIIGELSPEQVIYLINSHSGYGLFVTKNFDKGFVKLDKLKEESEEVNITTGISRITKHIRNEDECSYILKKGDNVLVKDCDEENKEYVIIDEFGNEFRVPLKYIGLNGNPGVVSRESILNRNFKVSENIENIYDSSGKSIKKSILMPGDLLFIGTSKDRLSRVGLYMGNDNILCIDDYNMNNM